MSPLPHIFFFFFFNDTATTEIYTLSLHDALPIWICGRADFIQLMVHFGAGRNDDGFPELSAHRNGREETNEEQDSENSYSNHACLLWNGLRGELWFTPHLSARWPYSANFQDEHSPIIGIGPQ